MIETLPAWTPFESAALLRTPIALGLAALTIEAWAGHQPIALHQR